MPQRILVVDDETAIADLVEVYLQGEGFTVHKFHNAADALASVNAAPPDLAILDVMLPDLDGFPLCRRIREQHLFPILMLTARGEDLDKITGLTLGMNFWNALVIGVLGLPGFGLLLLVHWVL